VRNRGGPTKSSSHGQPHRAHSHAHNRRSTVLNARGQQESAGLEGKDEQEFGGAAERIQKYIDKILSEPMEKNATND